MNRGRGPDPNTVDAIAESRRHLMVARIERGLTVEEVSRALAQLAKRKDVADLGRAREALTGVRDLLVASEHLYESLFDLLGLAEAWL